MSMKKGFFQKKHLIFIIPVLLLLVLIVAAAPGAIYREHRYRSGVNLLRSGDWDAAETLFQEIPSYRDSAVLLEQEIPYLRAGRLMEAAEAGEEASLESAGHSVSELDDHTTAAMVLYEEAAERFEALGEYKDSVSLADACRSGIDRETERLKKEAEEEALRQNQTAYQNAKQLLESGAYSEAMSAFQDLGSFSDSREKALECKYRKAVSIFHFLSSYDVSRIYAGISMDPEQTSIFSLPSAEALRLGSGCVDELRAACGSDQTDIRLNDEPDAQLVPLKDALTEMFRSLGDYADSADYPDRIIEDTDYTRDFFMLCSAGDLNAARNWLNSFEGVFPDRQRWSDLLEMYLPYCGNWVVYLGDAHLLPYTVGQDFAAMSVSSRVILTKDEVWLRLSFGDGNTYNFDLPSNFGETLFINTDLDSGIYMAALNNGHFVYMRYNSNWDLLSSCDFIRS
ncbi:MAG: hypothetical protein IJV40_12555 [Oscillospiraceae bacterium]|nr:hypothetical protein [Oscillospiraceae bacterium]